MNIAILGFGQEGKAILKFLRQASQYKNSTITILDKKLDKNYLKNLEQFDIIFRSPGVLYNLPEIQSAVKKEVKFSSSTKLFFKEIEKIGCQIIGITGTKGKGTTSTLLYKILKTAGKNTYLAGNIGKPAIEILPKLKKKSIVILELSSFQLQDLKQSPNIAVILNIFEDHLDSHKNFKEYINAKANIAKWQKKSDKIFYLAENKNSQLIAQKSKGRKVKISLKNFKLFKPEDLKIKGRHNYENAIMAATIAKYLNIKNEIIKKISKNFRGLEHRLEFVRQIKNINFYNDSSSTNPHTAAAAIKTFPNKPKILICGGKDKNLNYSPLAKALKDSNTKLVIIFGENKEKIKRKLKIGNWKLEIKICKNLKSAIMIAYKTAQKPINQSTNQSRIILFSPASASFDMFSNYEERGKKFKELVEKLA